MTPKPTLSDILAICEKWGNRFEKISKSKEVDYGKADS
jgi:hypothetical protein